MAAYTDKITRYWHDSVNMVLGAWLILSPFALRFFENTAAAWNVMTVGVVVLVAAGAAIIAFHRWEEWVNTALGVWLIASAWILGYGVETALVWNQVLSGALIGGLALWSGFYGHADHGETAS